jgi:hypothetical protein
MFLGASALRLPFEAIVAARRAERNGLMVYAFGYFQPIGALRNAPIVKDS